ncbi:MAG TPA: hypothetical protein VN376_07320 [Longilinea sp.]|nr:hypothetical protein [Longilinea sp.]
MLIFAVLGAVIGILVAHATPVQYQSTAVVTVGINFVLTGELTDEQQDQTMQAVDDYLTSEEILDPIFGDTVPQIWVFRQPVSSERQGYHFLLYVRGANAEETAQLVDAWAQEAASALQGSVHHAEIANTLQHQADSIVACLESAAAIPPVYVPCEGQSIEQLRTQLDELFIVIDEERQASHGILSTAQISYEPQGQSSTQIVNDGQNLLVFMGSFIGLLISLVLVISGLLEKMVGKRHG